MKNEQKLSSICRTCLTRDRTLIPVNFIDHLIFTANLDLGSTGSLCWECHSILLKYFKFKNQVNAAQDYFKNFIKTNCHPKSLSKLSVNKKLNFDVQYTYGDPVSNDIKPRDLTANIKKEQALDNNNIDEITADFQDFEAPQKPANLQDVLKSELDHNKERPNYNDSHNANKDYLTEDPLSSDENYVKLGHLTDNIKKDQDFDNNVLDENTNDYEDFVAPQKPANLQDALKYKLYHNKRRSKNTVSPNVDKDDLDEENLTDIYMNVTITEEEMLSKRERRRNEPNYKKLPYKCDSCVMGFMKKQTYDDHFSKRHDKNVGEFTCNVCESRFKNLLAANRHRIRHTRFYKCKICKFETSELTSVVIHCKMKHKGDSVDRIHCSDCRGVFKTDEELRAHRRIQHVLKCEQCAEVFVNKGTLRGHIRRIHTTDREFACQVCKKQFPTKSRLESHLVSHGGKVAKELAYCAVCDVQYKSLGVYRSHLKTTTLHPRDAYECSECHKWFASRAYCQRHFDFYHLDKAKYKCDDCDKPFMSKFKLNQHRATRHGGERTRDHKCEECGKSFYSSMMLKGHRLTHSSVRGFMCSECGDTFKQSAALYTHTRLVHKRLKRPNKQNK